MISECSMHIWQKKIDLLIATDAEQSEANSIMKTFILQPHMEILTTKPPYYLFSSSSDYKMFCVVKNTSMRCLVGWFDPRYDALCLLIFQNLYKPHTACKSKYEGTIKIRIRNLGVQSFIWHNIICVLKIIKVKQKLIKQNSKPTKQIQNYVRFYTKNMQLISSTILPSSCSNISAVID